MHILIYYDSFQEDYYQKLKGYFPDIVEIKNAYNLQLAFYESHHPILVMISQPTKAFMETLLSRNWFRIISHIGIRDIDTSKFKSVYFEDENAFKVKMDQAIAERNSERLQSYINQFEGIDDDDVCYLEALSGLAIKKKQVSNKFIKSLINRKIDMKKGLITVMGSSEIASAIAKSISKHTNTKVLVIDGDLMKPSMDQVFRINNLQTSIKSHMTGMDNTGINIALDTMVKGFDLGQGLNAYTKYGGRNIRVMLGNYNLYNYEHYDEKQVKLLLSRLHSYFHTIILNIGDNPYDSLTMLGLHMSSINLIACQKSIADIRFKYSLLEVLSVKQGIPQGKNLIMTFDDTSQVKKVSSSVIQHLFKKNYVGHYNPKHLMLPNWLNKISERMTVWD
jgi:MinD-like ATPase involved in chromosome partitioning or flagellar assembly